MILKIKLCFLITIFSFNILYTQDAREFVTKYKFKLLDEKKLRPFNAVKMNLEIENKDGKFPASLILLENMLYKLEVTESKSKSIEYIDQMGYMLMSANGKEKQMGETNSELHLGKKLWLNFYPLLSSREDAPMRILEPGIAINSSLSATAAMEAVDASSVEIEDLSIKKIYQPLPFNEFGHIFYVDMKTMDLIKIETRYTRDGIEKKDITSYGKYLRSPEGYAYPSSFTTVFGMATVKSIQFNPKLNPAELEVKF